MYLAGARKLSRRRITPATGHKSTSVQQSGPRQRSDAQFLAAVKNFESAVRYFQRQQYDKASEIFAKVAEAPAREVADRAKTYLRLCRQKQAEAAPSAKTAQDYYLLGVAHLNARNLEEAIKCLTKADGLDPKRDHIRYALAAAHALQGNTHAALEHLKAAVQIQPRVRYQARHDDDLQSLASDPRFRRLVLLEGSTPY